MSNIDTSNRLNLKLPEGLKRLLWDHGEARTESLNHLAIRYLKEGLEREDPNNTSPYANWVPSKGEYVTIEGKGLYSIQSIYPAKDGYTAMVVEDSAPCEPAIAVPLKRLRPFCVRVQLTFK